MSRTCIHCGLLESDHCIFQAMVVPPGCVCNPGEWDREIPPPCEVYVGTPPRCCDTCEHDQECHQIG
ncbi:MAG: hypothetical protein UY48_C0003G0037 [Candidatus Gottesmanbacteria bacterium GW2011_GWB1_49_7]|uniref:Uncharacterized protein n=1 Tax=Candidatus Gottesmanbacteria bacterium GW2011_GWB1_49_7 TaxID=1618448 RepID=A0A0G1W3S3_9BACT|nr:MAG: hypothetical protein UY48_C0003G0037 [Candidatus Gottesmanbacteria bacterium GW2011_GWB1_49_7]